MSGWRLGPEHPDYGVEQPYGTGYVPRPPRPRKPAQPSSRLVTARGAQMTTEELTGQPLADDPGQPMRRCTRCATPKPSYQRCLVCHPRTAKPEPPAAAPIDPSAADLVFSARGPSLPRAVIDGQDHCLRCGAAVERQGQCAACRERTRRRHLGRAT